MTLDLIEFSQNVCLFGKCIHLILILFMKNIIFLSYTIYDRFTHIKCLFLFCSVHRHCHYFFIHSFIHSFILFIYLFSCSFLIIMFRHVLCNGFTTTSSSSSSSSSTTTTYSIKYSIYILI